MSLEVRGSAMGGRQDRGKVGELAVDAGGSPAPNARVDARLGDERSRDTPMN